MFEKIQSYLAAQLDISPDEITRETTFESLGIDSLDTVEMVMDLESELGVDLVLKIGVLPDGSIADETVGALPEDAVVSMNFWGFAPSFFEELEKFFYDFLRNEAGDNIKAECMLPSLVGKLIVEGKLDVTVLRSADRWFGMTYHEDRQAVAQELQRLHESGVYPKSLRG